MNCKILKDEQLISNIRESGCSDSIVELTERHTRLVVQVIKKYANAAECSGISLRDFLDDAHSIVFEAARKFDSSKNMKFTTWLGNRVRFHCLNTLNRQSRYYCPQNNTEYSEKLANSISNEDEVFQKEIAEQIEYITNILSQIKDKRIERIIRMRYLNGTSKKGSFSDIAKTMGMSVQGVIDLHDSFIKFLSEKMQAEQNMDEI